MKTETKTWFLGAALGAALGAGTTYHYLDGLLKFLGTSEYNIRTTATTVAQPVQNWRLGHAVEKIQKNVKDNINPEYRLAYQNILLNLSKISETSFQMQGTLEHILAAIELTAATGAEGLRQVLTGEGEPKNAEEVNGWGASVLKKINNAGNRFFNKVNGTSQSYEESKKIAQERQQYHDTLREYVAAQGSLTTNLIGVMEEINENPGLLTPKYISGIREVLEQGKQTQSQIYSHIMNKSPLSQEDLNKLRKSTQAYEEQAEVLSRELGDYLSIPVTIPTSKTAIVEKYNPLGNGFTLAVLGLGGFLVGWAGGKVGKYAGKTYSLLPKKQS